MRPFINVEPNSPFFLPIGLLSIAAAVRSAGHRVYVIDFEFEHRTGVKFAADEPLQTFAQRVLIDSPDVVGITVLADTLPAALALGRQIKSIHPDVVVVLGGPGMHGTDRTIATRFSGYADYLCVGEGEGALPALLATDMRGDAPGMLRVGNAVSLKTEAAPHVDSLPFPAYDLLDVPAYLAIASPRIFDLHVGSGCTYKCSFCSTAPFWKHKFAARAPSAILGEMERLERVYGIRKFNLIHDNFVNDKRYIDAFVDHFAQHNTLFTWGCAVRPDNVSLDLMQRMKTAGCTFLFCGTDAGDSAILRDMRKMTSSTKSYRFFNDARSSGLIFETNTIIGYPNESDEALELALKIVFDAIAHGGLTADVSVLQPLPGTPIAALHRDKIEPTLEGILTYLPQEARELIANHRDLFTGFGFIRQGNRTVKYYLTIAELVRYFTRHYFKTIYFLKERLSVPYRAMLEAVAEGPSLLNFGERLIGFANSLELTAEQRDTLTSVINFETGIEASKGVDVRAELTNVYARPGLVPSQDCIVVDVGHQVDKMFAMLPSIQTVPPSSTSYLFRCIDAQVVIVRLKPWQRDLWETFKSGEINRSNIVEVSSLRLADQAGTTLTAARSAVTSVLTLFGASDNNRELSLA